MANIINLRLARKRKARVEKAEKAAENRARFGRTKAEKQHERLQEELDRTRLDGAHVEPEEKHE
ncbi:MAG: DUF4169 family protein [Nevskiaceae bacterium]|nr:MAG: DUF4169 family protein [Nevskiaceae bacterium]TBR72254.1 MAG: DUF4169 family protein [Nevskiaceae bacterium]